MNCRARQVLWLIVGVWLGAIGAARAATITVNSTNDPAGYNPGITIPGLGPTVTLRDAVNAATNTAGSDVITFASALTNGGPATITLHQGAVTLATTLTINGPGANALQISGNNASRVFSVSPGADVTLAGLTIAQGRSNNPDPFTGSGGGIRNAGILAVVDCVMTGNVSGTSNTGAGGAIYSYGPSLTLLRTTLSGNRAQVGGYGGGVHLDEGMVQILDSVISGNSASGNGGGVSCVNATLTMSNTSVTANSAVHGGGIFSSVNGDASIIRCSISGNLALGEGNGGGMYTDHGAFMIAESTFSHNASSNGNGGAIANIGAVLTATNCTFAHNHARQGGAIIQYGSTLTLVHGSVFNNTAVDAGGGVVRVARTNSVFRLINTVVSGNSAPVGPDARSVSDVDNGAFTSLGHNLIGDGTGAIGFINGVNGDIVGTSGAEIATHAGALQDNGGATMTVALFPGSPAINAATAIPGLAGDQRGFPRSLGGAPDIGAFEVRIATPPLKIQGVSYSETNGFSASFTNVSGAGLSVVAATNLLLPPNLWSNIGAATEAPPGSGHYAFEDPDATNFPIRFYRVRLL